MKISFDPITIVNGVNTLVSTVLNSAGKRDWRTIGVDVLKIAMATAITAARVEYHGKIVKPAAGDYFAPATDEGEYRGG